MSIGTRYSLLRDCRLARDLCRKVLRVSFHCVGRYRHDVGFLELLHCAIAVMLDVTATHSRNLCDCFLHKIVKNILAFINIIVVSVRGVLVGYFTHRGFLLHLRNYLTINQLEAVLPDAPGLFVCISLIYSVL